MGASGAATTSSLEVRFRDALDALVSVRPARWLIGFSGGLDSTVLLHLMKRVDATTPIVAVHVDHGLNRQSASWAAQCARAAADLGVAFDSREVSVQRSVGQSLESVARRARYDAFAGMVSSGDILLTAHHADDQLETVLLRMLRGTGVQGLTAVRAAMTMGEGRLARPLLSFSRAELLRWAQAQGLAWIDDPSNEDDAFDRNYLRRRCLPPLLDRWPAAGKVADRLAQHMLEAQQVLDHAAGTDLAGIDDHRRLPVDRLLLLPSARRRNALRHALRDTGLPVPTTAQLAEVERILEARDDACALVSWPGAEARVYRGHLYLLEPVSVASAGSDAVAPGQTVQLKLGTLTLERTPGYGIPFSWAQETLRIEYRQGGERFRPHRSKHRKSLKHWFQEAGIFPWVREIVPLLYYEDRLIAIADLCLADELPQDEQVEGAWLPVWRGCPRIR